MFEVVVENIEKNYGNIKVVDNTSFHVDKGDIFAILGPNGAGKTTTFKIMTGLVSADSGEILYRGKSFHSEDKKIKSIISVVPQENNVDNDLTVYQNLLIHCLLYKIPASEINKRIDKILAFSGVNNFKKISPSKLSGGMKRRLVIGRALLHEPGILFLDEPTAGLDPAARRHIWDFIRKINKLSRCTIFLTTHYIEEAEVLANKVIIMDKGSIIARGTPQNLKEKIGEYTVEIYHDDSIEEKFFFEKKNALGLINQINHPAKIRRVNLEDVYLKITGRRIVI